MGSLGSGLKFNCLQIKITSALHISVTGPKIRKEAKVGVLQAELKS